MSDRLPNIHPGDILREDWKLDAQQLAIAAGVDEEQAQQILDGKSPVTEAIAWELHTYLGCSVAFWKNLQQMYDEREERGRDDTV